MKAWRPIVYVVDRRGTVCLSLKRLSAFSWTEPELSHRRWSFWRANGLTRRAAWCWTFGFRG